MKLGRPKIVIDLEMVERLANIQCTLDEISGVMKIPESTLKNRNDFMSVYKNGVKGGKASLRRIQFRMAETSAAMAIWLGKQYLGQCEKIEVTNTELMREELEIIPSNGKKYNRYAGDNSRLTKFINN